MTKSVEILIYNIDQLVTCATDIVPRRGAEMRGIGLLDNGAIAVADGKIVAAGSSGQILAEFQAQTRFDASGHAVMPGLVDPHTHTVFSGDRAHEYEMRVQGADYLEILAAGGGIVSTMLHTREASETELVDSARARLDEMLALGTTTVEIKSGYGLDTGTELKMLRVIEHLDQSHPCTLVPTFLGAHTLPPEYKNDAGGYVDLVVEEMIPAVAEWYESSHFAAQNVPLGIDVFCEVHAFNVEQSRRILEAGQMTGMIAKLHVDQFNAFGGTRMAVDVGAASADHLDVSGSAEVAMLATSNTVAIPLPAANVNLGQTTFARARSMIDAGAALALATDLNPGSAPCYSMPFVMAIATRYLQLLPDEAITASTINAAHALRIANRLGSIEVGKQADLLLLKSSDYRYVSYFLGWNPVKRVMANGKWID